MALLGYARVSTVDQDPQLQLDALEGVGCERIWTDQASGARTSRPQLEALLDHLRTGDTLVVWKLDRLGRSMSHLLELSVQLDERSVELRSITEGIDTSTPAGRLYFHVLGALAQFERDLLRERTMAGLEAARRQGRRGGRPRKLTPQKLDRARELMAEGTMTMAEVGAAVGVSRSALYQALNRADQAAASTS